MVTGLRVNKINHQFQNLGSPIKLMTSHPNGGEGVTRFVTRGRGGVSSFVMSHEESF